MILRRAVPAAGREGLLVPWEQPAVVSDDGAIAYREAWPAGSITPAAERLPVFDGHNPATMQRGALVGALDDVRSAPDGLVGRVTFAGTGRGAEVAELARLLDVGLSVELELPADAAAARPGADGVLRRSGATLTGLAVVLPPNLPAYAEARLRETGVTLMSDPTVPDPVEPDPDAPAPDPEPEDAGAPVVSLARVRQLVGDELARARLAHPTGAPVAGGHPLQRFADFGAYTRAAVTDRTLLRALADQITTNNPGVMPPGWVSEVFGIIDQTAPLVAALRRPAPPSGLDVNWPYFDGDLYALVGAQAAEKTPITSVVVSLKRGTEPLVTFAGGSDISYQLITRSDPSYLDAYMRIMASAYAAKTAQAFSNDLLAGADGHVVLDPATATIDQAAAALFEASAEVAAATGAPASVVAAGRNMFVALGRAALATKAGDTAGSASASTLALQIAGLSVVLDLTMAPDLAVATNRQGAAAYTDGPFTITAEDVEKLGRNVAVWGLQAGAIHTAAGVVQISATAPVLDSQSSSRSSRSKG